MYKLLYHFSVTIYYIATMLYHKELDVFPELSTLNFPFNTNLNYLTFWNIAAQTICVGIATIMDVYQISSEKSKLYQFYNVILTCVAFPLALTVSVSFWLIYAIDRELVYPSKLDALIPSWLNHVMHTFSPFLLLTEYFIEFHKCPRRKIGCTISYLVFIFYTIWIHIVKYHTDVWMYPLFESMNLFVRTIFLATLGFGIVFMFLVGEKINHLFWPQKYKKLEGKTE